MSLIPIVLSHYKTLGRHDLPWRKTKDPYKILVSEIMLQQTQVVRVVPKYTAFLKRFPTVNTLAEASLADVLTLWQGLGYNRRAKMLHEAAKQIVQEFGGKVPKTYEALHTLRGVGDYTARAVCVFAYNMPLGLVETNVRTVFFHHIFKGEEKVSDGVILEVAEKILQELVPSPSFSTKASKDEFLQYRNSRVWYWALMDYGAWLKGQGVRTNTKSTHYTKQKSFKGSTRELRGAIVRTLTQKGSLSVQKLTALVRRTEEEVLTQISRLKKEGIVQQKGKNVFLQT